MINFKVCFAIMFIDDFTNNMVNDLNIQIFSDNILFNYVINPDGFFVITKTSNDIVNILIKSDVFLDIEKQIIVSKIDNPHKLVTIRLYPNKKYFNNNSINQIEFISGVSEKKSNIYAVLNKSLYNLQINKSCHQNDTSIMIYNPFELNLTAKSLYIKSNEHSEFIYLEKCKNNLIDTYYLKNPLKYNYEHKNFTTSINWIFETICNNNGSYNIPIPIQYLNNVIIYNLPKE